MEDLQERWKTLMVDVPKSDWNTPENSEKWQKMYQEMRDSPTHKQLQAECNQLEEALQKYVEGDPARPGSPDVPHGYVWFFRRK